MTKAHLWFCHITSFTGMGGVSDLMAKHHYAQLIRHVPEDQNSRGTQKIRIEQILTAAMAKEMSEYDDTFGRMGSYKAGDATNRFDTDDEAVAAASVVWKAVSSDGDAMILDDEYSTQPPYRVDHLHGTDGFTLVTKNLHGRAEACGWYDTDRRSAEMNEIVSIWNDMVAETFYVDGDEDITPLEYADADDWEDWVAYVSKNADGTFTHQPGYDPYELSPVDKLAADHLVVPEGLELM